MPDENLVPFLNTPFSDPIFPGIEIPEADPFDEPKICFEYNHEYQPIITALMSRLLRRDAWVGSDAEKALGVQKANSLIALLQSEQCGEGLPDGQCTEYLPENPWTTYSPQNPFTQPDYVPGGYPFPPFYTGVTNILLGIIDTDVVTDLLHFPTGVTLPDLIGFSFPSIHINLSGTGEVELHFLKILQGGFVTVTVDGNPFQAKIIDLNALNLTDIESILGALGVLFGGGLSNEHIEEIEFTTPGAHTIDIVFYPHVGGDAIIGFGGALRAIHFCDTTINGDTVYMPISNMRLNEVSCQWEVQYNGSGDWIPIADYYVPECEPAVLPQTLIRADPTGCGAMQMSLNGGVSYTPITGTDYYRNDAACTALNFAARSDTARLRLANNAGTEQMRVGFKLGDATRAEVFTSGRDLEINWGSALQRMYFGLSDGAVHIDSAFPDVAGVKSAFRVNGRDSNYQVIKAAGRTGQLQPIIIAYATNTGSPAGDMFTGNYTGEGNNFRVKSKGELQYRSELTAIAKPASGGNALVHDVLSSFAGGGTAPLKGEVSTRVYDSGTAREAYKMRGEGGKARIGFLGADALDRQALSGDCMGNPVVKSIASILGLFGLVTDTTTLGEVPDPDPVPGVCDLSRCEWAETAARWLAYEIWEKVADIAGQPGLETDLSERIQQIEDRLHISFSDTVAFLDLCIGLFEEFSGESDDTALELRESENSLYLVTDWAQLLYCFMNDCGYVSQGDIEVMLSIMPNSTDADFNMQHLIRALGASGMAAIFSISKQSYYREALELTCSDESCDIWDVLFANTSSDIDVISGGTSGANWAACGGDVLILELSGFHVFRLSFTCYTNTGGEVTDPPTQIRAQEIGSSDWHYYDPHTGANDVSFAFNAPSGIRIEVSQVSSDPLDCVLLHTLHMRGLGTAPDAS